MYGALYRLYVFRTDNQRHRIRRKPQDFSRRCANDGRKTFANPICRKVVRRMQRDGSIPNFPVQGGDPNLKNTRFKGFLQIFHD